MSRSQRNALERQARRLNIGGSLAFKMLIVQRDWEAVAKLAPQQRGGVFGASALSKADWEWLRAEAAKDDIVLE